MTDLGERLAWDLIGWGVGALVVALVGAAAAVLASRTSRAARRRHARLAEQIPDNRAVPVGAYLDDGRIGLVTRPGCVTLIGVFAAVCLLLGVGLVLALSAEGDDDAVLPGVIFGGLGLLMGYLALSIAGTRYWLDGTGVYLSRFPGTRVRWVDVERMDTKGPAVRLVTEGTVASTLRRRGRVMELHAGTLEITTADLLRLCHQLWVAAAGRRRDGWPDGQR